jgi:hypothetical protein
MSYAQCVHRPRRSGCRFDIHTVDNYMLLGATNTNKGDVAE